MYSISVCALDRAHQSDASHQKRAATRTQWLGWHSGALGTNHCMPRVLIATGRWEEAYLQGPPLPRKPMMHDRNRIRYTELHKKVCRSLARKGERLKKSDKRTEKRWGHEIKKEINKTKIEEEIMKGKKRGKKEREMGRKQKQEKKERKKALTERKGEEKRW